MSEAGDRRGEEPVVAFRVGSTLLGVPVPAVREVLRAPRLAAADEATDLLAGEVEVRGERIPVLDLRSRLGLGGDSGRPRLLLVEHARVGPLALRVDGVEAVRTISREMLVPLPRYFAAADERGVSGLLGTDDHLMILLDVDHLLSPPEADRLARLYGRAGATSPGGGSDR